MMLLIISDDGHSTSIGGPNFFEFCPDYENAILWQKWIQFGIKCFSSGEPFLYY
jgi:hypothetical protein